MTATATIVPNVATATLYRVRFVLYVEASRWVCADSPEEAIAAARAEYTERGRTNLLVTEEGIDHTEITHSLAIGGCA